MAKPRLLASLWIRAFAISDQWLRTFWHQSFTSQAKKELRLLRKNKDKSTEKKLEYVEERTYNEVIGEMLKDTGIKTKVIKQYLPVMNRLINQYLQILDFFVSFHLDENFKLKKRNIQAG